MKQKLQHIAENFSDELKLLILLSKPDIHQNDTEQVKKLAIQINRNRFLELALRHRLAGHIITHLELLSEHFPENFTSLLIEKQQGLSKKSLLHTKYLLQVNKILTENQVPHLFFKGSLLSQELYGDLGRRDYKDIDMLVPVEYVEKARTLIMEMGFKMIEPGMQLSAKQRKVNYTISHHYHLGKPEERIEIELHWNLTNPYSVFPVAAIEMIDNAKTIEIAGSKLPGLSNPYKLVFLAAHGSIHQWYRLFWIKDFAEILKSISPKELLEAKELAETLKLNRCLHQGIGLANVLYNLDMQCNYHKTSIPAALEAIKTEPSKMKGVWGKIRFVTYRMQMKPDWRYYFHLLFRLRTHFTDWEKVQLKDRWFFVYYIIRPFLLVKSFQLGDD